MQRRPRKRRMDRARVEVSGMKRGPLSKRFWGIASPPRCVCLSRGVEQLARLGQDTIDPPRAP